MAWTRRRSAGPGGAGTASLAGGVSREPLAGYLQDAETAGRLEVERSAIRRDGGAAEVARQDGPGRSPPLRGAVGRSDQGSRGTRGVVYGSRDRGGCGPGASGRMGRARESQAR